MKTRNIEPHTLAVTLGLCGFVLVDNIIAIDDPVLTVIRGGLLIAFPLYIWIISKNTRSALNRGSVLVLAMAIGFVYQAGLFAALPALWTDTTWTEVSGSAESISAAARISVLAMASLWVGGAFYISRYARVPVCRDMKGARIPYTVWILMMLLGVGASLLETVGDYRSVAAIGRPLALVGAIGCLRESIIRVRKVGLTAAIVFVVLLSLAAADVLTRAQRGSLISAFIPIAVLYLRYIGRASPVILVPASLSLLGLLYLLPALNAFRTTGLTAVNANSLFSEVRSSGQNNASFSESIEWVVRRGSYIPMLGEIIQSTPGRIDYYKGSTYFYLPVWIVPRMFWPDKPDMNSGGKIARDYLGWNDILTERRSAVAPSLQGEAFANFGLPGVVFILIVIGNILARIDFLILTTESKRPIFSAWLLAFGVGLLTVEQTVDHYFLLTKAGLYVILPFCLFADRFYSRNPA